MLVTLPYWLNEFYIAISVYLVSEDYFSFESRFRFLMKIEYRRFSI